MPAHSAAENAVVTGAARRLEQLWGSGFGEAYTRRNESTRYTPGALHAELVRGLRAQRVLEVGCNLGLNLTKLAQNEAIQAFGVDVCGYALRRAAQRIPAAKLTQASLYGLPFADASFDLVFTCGVLIHVSPADLPLAMREIHRVTRRYVWVGEYYSPRPVELPYRDETEALFKADFGGEFVGLFPEARLRDRGFLEKAATGYDDLTWWLLEKA